MKASLSAILLLVVSGCMASTSVNSMSAPTNVGVQYHRVLVDFPTNDLEWRKTTEDAFVERDSSFVASYTIFFPGRTYSHDEIASLYVQYHLDATLMIASSGTGVDTYTTPLQTSTTCGAASDGVSVAAACASRQSGGDSYRKPWAQWTAKFWNVKTGEMVWMASSSTGGNAFANWHTVMHSMVKSTVSKLRQDHLISSGHT